MKKHSLTLLKIVTILYITFWCFIFGFVLYGMYSSYLYAQTFFTSAHVTPQNFFQEIRIGLSTRPVEDQGIKNILVLGVDAMDGRPDTAILTDTMMIVSLNTRTGSIASVSLPRDLWIDTYQTKINSFYQYGRQKYPDTPERFTTEVVEETFGIPIHHTVVVQLSDLQYIVDVLGGIDVSIPNSFEDALFPREGVDVEKVKDPKVLYKTVSFTKGVEHMDGIRALEYIRSRHSTDVTEGTDEARAVRQQIVIQSIVKAMLSKETMLNMQKMGSLYQWYLSKYGKVLPLSELIATANALYPVLSNIRYTPSSLSITENGKKGVIYHPNRLVDKQWVYLPVDPSWKTVQEEIRHVLYQ